MGHVKFQTTLLTKGVSWTDDEVKQAVDLYRTLYSDIRNFWHMCDRMLAHIARATHVEENWSKTPITTGPQCVFLPNGLPLVYNHLQVDGNGDWSYKAGNRWHKIYGAKATENWVQGVARIIMTDAEQKIDYPMVLTVHDELVFCVPDEHIDFASRQIETRMVEQPEWAVPFGPIPLAVELSVAKRYGDAK